MEQPSAKLKRILEHFGAGYSIRTIDCESVLYRKLDDRHDLEVSGLNRPGRFCCTIYVWQLKPGMCIVDQVADLRSLEQLERALEPIEARYSLAA